MRIVLDRCLVARPAHSPLTVSLLSAELGHPLDGLSDEQSKSIILSLDHALSDLAPHGFVTYKSGGHVIGFVPEARRFRTEPLTSTWTELRSGYLDPDDEAFLASLASMSEQPGADLADVTEIDARDVFTSLGWDWDGDRAEAIYRNLKGRFFIEGVLFGGPSIQARITYAGLVRALDEAGSLLREAEDHLRVGRLRAAGCVAAVELERRLKLIAPKPSVSRRDPGLEDYNQSAFKNGVIDQETWTLISRLSTIRKRCVHALDREPQQDEVRSLIDGVEDILRRYPAPS